MGGFTYIHIYMSSGKISLLKNCHIVTLWVIFAHKVPREDLHSLCWPLFQNIGSQSFIDQYYRSSRNTFLISHDEITVIIFEKSW